MRMLILLALQVDTKPSHGDPSSIVNVPCTATPTATITTTTAKLVRTA